MSLNYLENVYNSKDKKKGKITSIIVHLLLLLLGLYPMLTKAEAEETFPKPMLIQFSSLEGGGEGSSGGSSGSEGPTAADEYTESEVAEEVPVETVSEPTPEVPVEAPVETPVESRPVRTTIPSTENVTLSPNKTTTIDNSKSKQPVKLNQSKFSKPVPADFDLLPPRPDTPSSSSGSGKGTGSGSGTSTGTGSGSGSGTGAGDGKGAGSGQGSGTKAGDGQGTGTGAGKGPGSIFDGIGDLKRKIVYRPNLKVLAVEEGVIAYDVCVTKDGRVTQVVFDRKNSTIKDKETIQKTLDVANQYRFEPSPDGSALECGKLRLRITINL